jgi:hypothetical protein
VYTFKKNTVSELAAQNYNKRRIMQAGFIGFGITLTVGIVLKLIAGQVNLLESVPLIVYALSVATSGIYCTQPFLEGVQYSQTEARIHSILAQTAGFSFCIAILICWLESSIVQYKMLHGMAFIFVMLCSMLFGLVPKYRGAFQRIMYLGSFLWIMFAWSL